MVRLFVMEWLGTLLFVFLEGTTLSRTPKFVAHLIS